MRFAFFLLLSLLAAPVRAGEVVVRVTGGAEAPGVVGCALFAGPDGFPLNSARAVGVAAVGGISRFPKVAAGRYAVGCAKLPPGRTSVERDLVGRPKQPWGVSNNVRPALSAPSFADAAFPVAGEGTTRIEIEIAR